MTVPAYYKTRIVNKTIPSFTKFQITATVSADSNSTPQPVETMRLYALPVDKSVYTPYELAWRDIGSNVEDFMTGFTKMPIFYDEWEVGELSLITDNQDTGFVATTPATIRVNLYDTCQYEAAGSLMRYPATGMTVTAEGARSQHGLRLEILSDDQIRLVFTGNDMVLDFDNNWWSPFNPGERERTVNVQLRNGNYTAEYENNGLYFIVSFKEGGLVTIDKYAKNQKKGIIPYFRAVFRGSWLAGVFQSDSVEFRALTVRQVLEEN